VEVIFEGVFAEEFDGAINMANGDRRVLDAIEHVGLDRSVMNHILKNEFLPNLQFMVETPITHKIAGEATVAA
jgi:hypothetical protein